MKRGAQGGWDAAVWAVMLAISLAGNGGPAIAAEPAPLRVALPRMQAAPKIDGAIDEAEWRDAIRNVGFISRETGAVTGREGTFWIGRDGKALLLAVKTEAPPDGRILTRAVPDSQRDVVAAFHDDSIELVLNPGGDRFFRGGRSTSRNRFGPPARSRSKTWTAISRASEPSSCSASGNSWSWLTSSFVDGQSAIIRKRRPANSGPNRRIRTRSFVSL